MYFLAKSLDDYNFHIICVVDYYKVNQDMYATCSYTVMIVVQRDEKVILGQSIDDKLGDELDDESDDALNNKQDNEYEE